ncbi:MAG: Xaa-Pro peptidase family protein [Planctomycetota bacterium]
MKVETDAIDVTEYQRRRADVLQALKGSAAVVFAGEGAPPQLGRWRPDAHFYYLTGLDTEAGGAVLFDPTSENPKRRIVLFLRPLNIEKERWDGYRDPINSALKARTGFETIMRSDVLPGMLTGAARRAKTLTCLHGFSVYPADVSLDFAAFKKLSERIPNVKIEDGVNLLPSMRAVKSAGELKLMRKAAEITTAGFAAAMNVIRPGATEEEVSLTLEHNYRKGGAQGVAYNNIVGSGINGTVLHYNDNSCTLQKGDTLVIDSGCAYKNYACDVTRTYPIGGTFTPEQRDVYEVVLAAQLAGIKASRVGATFTDIDVVSRQVIEKAGYGDYYIHSIGHQLGIQVHDASPDGPLKAGMVITIEPGIYIPEKKFGVRIEDDIHILRKGNENLTIAVPKSVKDVEASLKD